MFVIKEPRVGWDYTAKIIPKINVNIMLIVDVLFYLKPKLYRRVSFFLYFSIDKFII